VNFSPLLLRIGILPTLTYMATRLDGNVRKATANTVTAMKRSAASRQCPECGRKSALVHDAEYRQTACRWTGRVGKNGNAMCHYGYMWDDRD
jgi:hypothetical protein